MEAERPNLRATVRKLRLVVEPTCLTVLLSRVPHLIESGPEAAGKRMNDCWHNDDIDRGIDQQCIVFGPLKKIGCHIQSGHCDSSDTVIEVDTSQEESFFTFEMAPAFRAVFMHDEPITKHVPFSAKATFKLQTLHNYFEKSHCLVHWQVLVI